jgi:hypothetical protein
MPVEAAFRFTHADIDTKPLGIFPKNLRFPHFSPYRDFRPFRGRFPSQKNGLSAKKVWGINRRVRVHVD